MARANEQLSDSIANFFGHLARDVGRATPIRLPLGLREHHNHTWRGDFGLQFSELPAGSGTFINLQATVPADDVSANYPSQQVLDMHAVTIGDGNDNEFPVVVDDSHHFVTYFADVSGNGRVNASDVAQVARFAALIDAGSFASLTTDPIVVGDISGNGRINAAVRWPS